MKLYPFFEVAGEARQRMLEGATVFQQFNCSQCGTKQTMGKPNTFHTFGQCEECNAITDIVKDGCNYMCCFGLLWGSI